MTKKGHEGHSSTEPEPDPEATEAIRRRLTASIPRLLEIEDPLARLSAVVEGVLDEVVSVPSVVDVLAGDRSMSTKSAAPDRLASTVRNLMATVVADAQRTGAIRGGRDTEMADLLHGGLVTGLMRWRDDGCPPDLRERGRRVVDLWLHGAKGDGVAVAEPAATGAPELRELDVRPMIARGEDPLQEIRDVLGGLAPGSLLHIMAPFRPTPLESLLVDAGHTVDIASVGEGAWSVSVVVDGGCEVADLRELEPPVPLEAVLTATVTGGPYVARLPRAPRLLAPHLDQRGLSWRVVGLEDDTALIWVAP